MDELETRIKQLIVDALHLEDIAPDEIDSDEALFVDGLGLDSIDALELGVALRREFGVKFNEDAKEVRAHFANVRSLAGFIASQQAG